MRHGGAGLWGPVDDLPVRLDEPDLGGVWTDDEFCFPSALPRAGWPSSAQRSVVAPEIRVALAKRGGRVFGLWPVAF